MNNENNNQNDNFFAKPTTNEQNNETKPSVEKVEIPQAYYDQLEEKLEQEKQAQIQKEKDRIEASENSKQSGKLMIIVLIFAIITYISIKITIKPTEIMPVILLGIIVVASIVMAVIDKDKSDIPDGILVGGILCAVVTFVMSMINKNENDLWTYYAAASGVVGILGYIISKIITAIVGNGKEVKAVQTIGMLLVIAAIIGVPVVLKQKYEEDFRRIVFREKGVIVATNQEEFVVKTLKNRYGIDFTCGAKKNKMDYVLHKQVAEYTCIDKKMSQEQLEADVKRNNILPEEEKVNNYITVASIPYNEAENLYIIEDNYLDKLYLDEIKEMIKTEIKKEIPVSKIDISLYPNGNCLFVGDCADCKEHYAVADEEEKVEVRFKTSSALDYSKDINLSPIEFMNKHDYKYLVRVSGHYAIEITEEHIPAVEKVRTALNNLGLKNNYGWEVSLRNSLQYDREVFKVVGEKNSDGFKDYIEEETTTGNYTESTGTGSQTNTTETEE